MYWEIRIPEFSGIILEVFNVMPGNLDYLLGKQRPQECYTQIPRG